MVGRGLRQEAGIPQLGGVRGSRWSFSINKDPDWIGGFFLSSGVRPFLVLSSPWGLLGTAARRRRLGAVRR